MLSKKDRLKKPADFARLRVKGSRWYNPYLSLNVLDNEAGYNRYGFVVSRKVGGAVQRNLLKRRLRAIVYRLRPYLSPQPGGLDMVIVAQAAAASLDYADLEGAANRLFSKARLISGGQAE